MRRVDAISPEALKAVAALARRLPYWVLSLAFYTPPVSVLAGRPPFLWRAYSSRSPFVGPARARLAAAPNGRGPGLLPGFEPLAISVGCGPFLSPARS